MTYQNLEENDSQVFNLVQAEITRQQTELNLIASENYVSPAVLEALASPLTNKYSEGYVGKRYYAGNGIIDQVEQLAIDRAKQVFGAEHVNVQPLSGAPANLAIYLALLKPGDKIMGLRLDQGGHLSHGHKVSFSGILFDFVHYEVDQATGRLDMAAVRELALKEKPKMIVAGFSAYSRDIDWAEFKKIADEVGAYTLADISHTAGLVAGCVLANPVPIFDIVMTTTHKTLRGPRGAMIMCKETLAKDIDRAIFPGMQGGPHENTIAALAVALGEALQPAFKIYAKAVKNNADILAQAFLAKGYKIVSDGTDTHLFILDLTNKNLSGKEAEKLLENAGIITSRSTIPFDPKPPFEASGIRLGTAAATTRGCGEAEMKLIADYIDKILSQQAEPAEIKKEIAALCQKFPLPY